MKRIAASVLGLAVAIGLFGPAPAAAQVVNRSAVIVVGPDTSNTKCEGKSKDLIIRARTNDVIRWVIVNNCVGNATITVTGFSKPAGNGHAASSNSPFAVGTQPMPCNFYGPGTQTLGPFTVANHRGSPGNASKTWYDYQVQLTWGGQTVTLDPAILIEQ